MNKEGIVESLLFAAGDEGLTAEQLAFVLNMEKQEVIELVKTMQEDWEQNKAKGLTITCYGFIYRLMTKKEAAPYIKMLAEKPASKSLSQAALETLAIIAYKQPITRVEIEEVRGVKTERPLATLAAHGLIKESGRADAPGRPILYATTSEFLDVFQLTDLQELPALAEGEAVSSGEADLFFSRFQEAFEDVPGK